MAQRHRFLIAIALLCGVVMAGCGSTSEPKASASSGKPQGIKFAECMRAHGVTNFPDPSASGGIQISPASGINPFSPAFKSAQSSCRKLLPGGGPGAGHPTAQSKAQMLELSQCMRRHGISEFPDPTLTPPSSPSGYSAVLGRGGVFLAIPQSIDTRSPAFKQAAAVCGFGPKRGQ